MVYEGKVTGGVVVLAQGARLPEGTAVKVEPLEDETGPDDDSIYRVWELAGPTGIPDLALNLDHYLYGHPKVNHGRQ
jgi:hypothetical protein